MEDEFKDIAKKLDLQRTDELFDITITRADYKTKKLFTDDDVKIARLVIQAGNLHVNSAKVKLGALRLVGYRDTSKQLEKTIAKKARNARKYARKGD